MSLQAGDNRPPASGVYSFEVSGDFDRATAEALMLEFQLLGKRCGVPLNGRVERVVDPPEDRSM